MEPQFLTVGSSDNARRIAVLSRPGAGPAVVWLGGFRSDMRATKATRLDEWAAAKGRACLRFDYSGHGESEGRFEDATIGRWLEETLAVLERFGGKAPILVGSSMGGWLALLAARELKARGLPLSGLVLIAPATDFTETLMWQKMSPQIQRTITEKGVWYRPSAYSPEPYPITRALIEEGREHLLFGKPIEVGAPVHILQGMEDPDVPWRHALALVEHLPGDEAAITLIKDGDHRLSREQDLALLMRTVEGMAPA